MRKKQNRPINHLFQIAFRNLKYYRATSFLLFFMMLLTTIAVTTGDLLTASMERGLDVTKQRIGADIIVVPQEYVSSYQNALFEGKPCTVYFDKSWMERLEQVEGVKRVCGQLFLASLSLGCCDGANQLIAIDPANDFIIQPWIKEANSEPMNDHEVIAGSAFGKQIGDTVTYYNRTFRVKAVLSETGMGYDTSMFLTYHAAYEMAGDPIYSESFAFSANRESISDVLIQIEEGYTINQVEQSIKDQFGTDGIAVYSAGELIGALTDSFAGFKTYGTWFKMLFLGMAIISLFSIYSIHIRQREHNLICMLSTGFYFSSVMSVLMIELSIHVLGASVAGVALTGIIIEVFRYVIRSSLSIPIIFPSLTTFVSIGIKVIRINGLLVGGIFLLKVWKMNKKEPALLMKE